MVIYHPLVYGPSNLSAVAENNVTSEMWLQLIEYYKVIVMASTPDRYNTILKDKKAHDYNIPSLRMTGSAGSMYHPFKLKI